MSLVKLGDIARECRSTYSGNKSGIPIVGLEHLTPGDIVLHSWDIDTDNTFSKSFKKGQVLLGRRRVYLKKASVAPFDGICSGDITVIEAIPEKLHPDLLPFIIQNDRFFEFAIIGSAGSLSPRVKWEYLKEYEINLPELNQQGKLVELLTSANELKHSYKEMILATDEMVKSQFIEMFGLPSANHKAFTVGSIADVVSDVHYGTSRQSNENGDYPYLRMNNITYEGDLDLSDLKKISVPKEELSGCLVKNGDVLFNRTNSKDLVGKTCCFSLEQPMIIAGYIIRLRMNGLVRPEYLSVFLNLPGSKKMLRNISKGAVGQANINAKEVQSISVLIPPIELQNQFVALKKQADKSKFELKQAIEKIDKVMRALMQ